jgi:hypothetical protein
MPEALVFPVLLVAGNANPRSMLHICTLSAGNQFISTVSYALPLLQRPDRPCVVRSS